MGSQVKAICKCGLNKEILIGGGRLNYLSVDFYPFVCLECQDVVEANLLEETPICPDCLSTDLISYKSQELIGAKGKVKIVKWGDNYLTNGTYKCPNCKQLTLQFHNGGIFWD